jgi:hypothetical protein
MSEGVRAVTESIEEVSVAAGSLGCTSALMTLASPNLEVLVGFTVRCWGKQRSPISAIAMLSFNCRDCGWRSLSPGSITLTNLRPRAAAR